MTDGEILRLRERLHELNNSLGARLAVLEQAFARLDERMQDMEKTRDKYVPVIEETAKATLRMATLAERLDQQRDIRFKWWHVVAGVAALASPYVLIATGHA